ncbi:alpha/beta fold hydrolase [Lacisediminihabitans profunda]|uniref:Alpha/beta hydrolase n=1 Tax=Lacisediminihabitans profunda TaxID=2594790 RepID=A0A5C8UMR8_9MICO|nr:alpha/beta hydrolase [Lacisediminihabitans profunda]TXN29712.1 alpha/beta hydrolase [Lacisediminihabitans profunda]
MVETVQSADGTTIAFDRLGGGPAVVVVGGAMNTRLSPYPLATLLADRFTVISYDRRGRGESGDGATYSVDREVDDLAAVVAATGGPAFVYGHSSGGILGLEAAARGVPVTRLAVYEPPYTFDPDGSAADGDPGVARALEAGDPEGAVRAFMRLTGMDDATIDGISHAPFWAGLVAIAHTLPYDLALSGDGRVPADRLSSIDAPTLVMDGGVSPAWAARAAEGLLGAIPGATRATLADQNHGVDHAVLAPVLIEFFEG